MAQLDAQSNTPQRRGKVRRIRCGNFSGRISPLRRPVALDTPRIWPTGKRCSTVDWLWAR
jgi:hypothetical protein